MSTDGYSVASGSGFGAIASAFVIDSLEEIIVLIIAVAAVVFCDLITGIARSLKQKLEIRFSRACRETIAKGTIYFSLIVCASMMQVAMRGDIEINKYACYLILLIEGSSIVNNVLGFHGMALNFNKIFALFIKKQFDVDTEDAKDIVVKQRRGKNGRFVKSGVN